MSGILAGSLSSSVALRRAPVASSRTVARRRRWRGSPLVISEQMFRDVLVRERRRADRFSLPFVLVLVSLREGRTSDPSKWQSVVDSLHAAKRDTDVIGWFANESVLGLIVPEIETSEVSFLRDVESRVSLALATRLDVDARADFSVRLHRHAGPTPAARAENLEPLLRDVHLSARVRMLGVLKRVLDFSASATLLLFISPLFLLISAMVKLISPGPVFFRQERVGEFGRPFTMLKFRTMHVNNDEAIHKEFVSKLIQGQTPNGGDGADTAFKIINDPRVTPIGRLLRKTSLDELPQLWNVLRGDMSLVGPRPPLAYEVEQYKPWHYRRVLEARPGITGLWQVSGRSRTTFDDMVRLDLRYAKKVSPWTDIKILLATPRAVISGKGAV
jgi:lipopolysaccharide/colanic/teichoic acid biosynthesis glycosyltransferase